MERRTKQGRNRLPSPACSSVFKKSLKKLRQLDWAGHCQRLPPLYYLPRASLDRFILGLCTPFACLPRSKYLYQMVESNLGQRLDAYET